MHPELFGIECIIPQERLIPLAPPSGTTGTSAHSEGTTVVKCQSGRRPSQAVTTRPILTERMELDPEMSVLESFLTGESIIGLVADGPGSLTKLIARGHDSLNKKKLEYYVRRAIEGGKIVSSKSGNTRHYMPAS